ncbi:SET domain protein, putative [Plasmodium chabaudi chabaudi]|uniref:SET domain protein, putative n=1 Tax=Plasmodium chabaudi chabaudi TaxID=31271 RepID=A0A4V0K791_PLACU|nr:SET domain protein, putative [Plasmodium chabaudi chabaudi]VTZ68322.1 SET domain protein, putative [Plasmodium chabaudi chabaudi]|eukprot:XP_742713.2 SET domain protein, putative [Plasmodium chabaudi chabaudi]
MSALIKILENANEVGFCSRIVKLQGGKYEKNSKKDEKQENIVNRPRKWLDYFNDIVKDELKDTNSNKYDIINNNSEIIIPLLKNHINCGLLLNNPFDFKLNAKNGWYEENKKPIKETSKKDRYLNMQKGTFLRGNRIKNNKITFDDLIWDNKLKKYVNVRNQQFHKDVNNLHYAKQAYNELIHEKKKKILKKFNKNNVIEFKGQKQNASLKSHMDLKNTCPNKLGSQERDKRIRNNSFWLCGFNNCDRRNKKSNNKNVQIVDTQAYIGGNKNSCEHNYDHCTDENMIKKVFERDLSTIGYEVENEIRFQSESIKNVLIKDKYDNIIMTQDKECGKIKLVANKNIEIGDVIFIEECFLETSIELDDLWTAFNSLNNEQKTQLNYITEFININKKNKKKDIDIYHQTKNSILKKPDQNENKNRYISYQDRAKSDYENDYVLDKPSNFEEREEGNIYKHSFSNIGSSENYVPKMDTEKIKFTRIESSKADFFKRETTDDEQYINNLIKFENFTDILKNSFISPKNKNNILLFKKAYFINHSCFPNSSYCFMDNNKICFIAMRKINMYDEISISFINELYASIEYRKKKLNDIKNISCSCNRCLQIIDENRNILCSFCKYVYVKKRVDDQYKKAMETKNELLLENEKNKLGGQLVGNFGINTVGQTPKKTESVDNGNMESKEINDNIYMNKINYSKSQNKRNNLSEKMQYLNINNYASQNESLKEYKKENEVQENYKLSKVSNLENNINLDSNLLDILNTKSVEEQIGYCKLHNNNTWKCDRCIENISEYSIPLSSEALFIKEYTIIKEKINNEKCDIESIISKIEKSLLYVIAILGKKHWLYAAFNYLIADLCFSLYNNNHIDYSGYNNYSCYNVHKKSDVPSKEILLKGFKSFHNFLDFIQINCPYTIHTDLVPLVLKFLIILIYTYNYESFYDFAKSGFLELIKQKYGAWDISYISLLYSFKICCEQINNSGPQNIKILFSLAELAKMNMSTNHFY